METKKSNEANLEKRRPIFIQMGFVIALTLVLTAFEWSTEKDSAKMLEGVFETEVEVDMINTFREEPEPVRPEPKPTITQLFDLVEDDEEIDDDDLDIDSESDENMIIFIDEVDDEVGDDDIPFEIVENMPIFRPHLNSTKEEGDIDLHKFALNKARYPDLARENGIEGKVWVRFVVDKKGKVSNVEVVRGAHELLDNEALRVVKQLPDFSPGMQRGKKVKVYYHVPINFKLG